MDLYALYSVPLITFRDLGPISKKKETFYCPVKLEKMCARQDPGRIQLELLKVNSIMGTLTKACTEWEIQTTLVV